MARLTRTLADTLTTREIVVDTKDGEDVTVKIRPIDPSRLLSIFKDSKKLTELVKNKKDGKEISDADMEELISGDFNLGAISSIVSEVMVDPQVVDEPTSENQVTLQEIAPYQLKIFHAAMDMSGFGDDVETFRDDTDSDASGVRGEGVRETPNGTPGARAEESTVAAPV